MSPIDYDQYEEYEEQVFHFGNDRQARRKRKPEVKHIAKKSHDEIIEAIANVEGVEGGFNPTYQPSKHESTWLLAALQSFYEQALIKDVQALVKGGKEASVYRCEGAPATNTEFLAAKVYRPRMFRSLSNDKMYREGRQILNEDGRAIKPTDTRIMRALGKKTEFGAQVAHTSWLMYEYKTMETLHKAGANVPKPLAASENAILMSYYGDEQMAAPTLSEVRLDPKEAEPLFHRVLRNIELMLQHGMIHGDLSAYNILYWEGQIVLIDFPQVSDANANSNAHFILRRDIERICEYFGRQGVKTDSATILDGLVKRYMRMEALPLEDLEEEEF